MHGKKWKPTIKYFEVTKDHIQHFKALSSFVIWFLTGITILSNDKPKLFSVSDL